MSKTPRTDALRCIHEGETYRVGGVSDYEKLACLLELENTTQIEKIKQLERELNEVKAEISNIETHLEVHQCRTIRSPHMDVLHAVQERSQWRTMAQELAAGAVREVAMWDRDGEPCGCNKCAVCELRTALSRFNELNTSK